MDRIIAISSAARERLEKDGIDPAAVSVVFSGLEFSPLENSVLAEGVAGMEFRRKLGVPTDAWVMVHAAALTSEKRQNDILSALSRSNEALKGRKSGRVHLVLAGSGVLEQALRDQARLLGIEDCVHFLGFVQDLRPVWAAGNATIFASEAEGLCTALIEAQAAGLPAVITRAGGMTEVVEHGKTGLITEIGDVPAMAEAIATLAQDQALRQTMAHAAAARTRRLFSSEQMIEGVLRVYREALGVAEAKLNANGLESAS